MPALRLPCPTQKHLDQLAPSETLVANWEIPKFPMLKGLWIIASKKSQRNLSNRASWSEPLLSSMQPAPIPWYTTMQSKKLYYSSDIFYVSGDVKKSHARIDFTGSPSHQCEYLSPCSRANPVSRWRSRPQSNIRRFRVCYARDNPFGIWVSPLVD